MYRLSERLYKNSLTNRATQFCECNAVADTRPTPNLVVPGQTVYAYVAENQQNWGPLGPRCLGMEDVADLLEQAPSHMC